MQLTDRDHQMLQFEALWWKSAGAKDAEIRIRFDCSPTIYYQRLNYLIDTHAALIDYPQTVLRLMRLRSARKAVRTG